MRTIERKIDWTSAFKRDFKREKKMDRQLENILDPILTGLVNDNPIPDKYADHPMTGTWKDCRDCHVKPDLVLLYQKPDNDALRLVRLGSHAELGI
ncbi:MAG: type II toxin-antitoxin system YafQ family toxin [Deltaproteobacteria bacterium]|jgi:mRNA interferase YafQ|nr:type II toxin-antitoxin system YafQ family toxin [Deltaproteobacteria bacterium]